MLVVDDNQDVRQLVTAVLSEEGHQIAIAANGDSALKAMRLTAPDILILDIMMPEVDGYSVLKKMTEEGIKQKTKVLVLTAKTAEADWIRGYRLGADYYLTKPFTMDELIRTLNEMIRMTHDQLRKRRTDEIEKARLFSRLENVFDD
ncbi:MAG: two-component system, sensor histidine kinase and response regulator [Actinomycetota bacterium]|jgi:two-component system OmpR family response regulator|nr:two-component system, sensor histidine kinase and response regulator [Actinomycetota bacterium]